MVLHCVGGVPEGHDGVAYVLAHGAAAETWWAMDQNGLLAAVLHEKRMKQETARPQQETANPRHEQNCHLLWRVYFCQRQMRMLGAFLPAFDAGGHCLEVLCKDLRSRRYRVGW
jgi:hypothetical protein